MGIGVALRVYAEEHSGAFPPMHGRESYGSDGDTADDIRSDCDNAQPDLDFIFSTSAMVPEYITDPAILVCPSSPSLREDTASALLGIAQTRPGSSRPCAWEGLVTNGDASYLYFGWALDKVGRSSMRVGERLAGLAGVAVPGMPSPGPGEKDWGIDAQVAAMVDAIRSTDGQRARLDAPLDVAAFAERVGKAGRLGTGGSDTLLRLRDGVDRLLVEDIDRPDAGLGSESSLPVCWDSTIGVAADGSPAFSHLPGGSNVLYMDGHVRFVRMGESGVLAAPAVRASQGLRALVEGIR